MEKFNHKTKFDNHSKKVKDFLTQIK